jgi:hypothetical protein
MIIWHIRRYDGVETTGHLSVASVYYVAYKGMEVKCSLPFMAEYFEAEKILYSDMILNKNMLWITREH